VYYAYANIQKPKNVLQFLQARETLEAAGEVPEINEPYVYDHHIDLEEDENDEDSLHKFFAMVSTFSCI
jgi:hypothetical protein